MHQNPYIVLEKVEEGVYKAIYVNNLADAFAKCLVSSERIIVKKIETKVIEKYDK